MACHGESLDEALDTELCYYSDLIVESGRRCKTRAFRYVFLPGQAIGETECSALLEELPQTVKGKFDSNDEELNRIWQIAAYTFRLNSRVFFLDGVKRDQWIWSGDAYQYYFINRYLCNDKANNERTILALRGKDPVTQHINTIVDYSLFWIISCYDHYLAYGDKEFLRKLYPKMESMMQFCLSGCDKEGFLIGKEGDWIFIDWAEFDREGPLFALQILLVKALEVLSVCGKVVGIETDLWETRYELLKNKVLEQYWDEEKGAFLDSIQSNKKCVTRHGNIFALLFGYLSDGQKDKIIENVLLNQEVPAITTPYFKLYELEALCQAGRYETVCQEIKRYWGGMVKLGATTFWEEYCESDCGKEHYTMYGDPYGKSLAHAWGSESGLSFGKIFCRSISNSAWIF